MNKVWLASFPRSGNTFVRNILYHVYGVNSFENEFELENDNQSVTFVKTHELPFKLKKYSRRNDKVIYLVRDGRDSICSIAHQRKNLVDFESDLLHTIKEATIAECASYFGGWKLNCSFWLAENPILIRFEDLIQNPKKEFEKIEKIINLPEANWDQLPTFIKQKSGDCRFGNLTSDDMPKNFSQKFFRKGKVGDWKTEMPEQMQDIFWETSSPLMEALGYDKEGQIGHIDYDKVKHIVEDKNEYKLKRMEIVYSEFRLLLRKYKNSINFF